MDQYRLDISKFSNLARGTGTSNGVIVGEGSETLGDQLSASYPGIELEKPKTAPLPSTYLTRRGTMMLYSRPDVSPSWKQDVLSCYNNMGSLLDGIESVSLKKEEKVKDMDPRCVPGRHFNGYVGVLKNSLLCSDTMKTMANIMDMLSSSHDRKSFPRKGRSPGLELLPMHLEEMGVNIAEFLHGKGCYDHLIPPENMSMYLPDLSTSIEKDQMADIPGSAEGTAQPTPAPPQSPLPDDTNQNQRVTRIGSYSAGRRRTASARRTGSARSAGLTSEADSAYGTKFPSMNRHNCTPFWRPRKARFFPKLPPIDKPAKLSADMSTYRSVISTPNRLDTAPDRLLMESKLTATINNSGDRSKEQMFWVPNSDRITHSSPREEPDGPDARMRVGDSNKLLARTRVAEWVNAADSGIPPPSTPLSHTDEAEMTEETEDEMGKENSFFTSNQTASTLSTEFDVRQDKKSTMKTGKRERISVDDTSSLGQVTVTSTFETATIEQSMSHMKSIDEGIDEKASSRILASEDDETKAFSLSELDDEGNDAAESEDFLQSKTLNYAPQPRQASSDLRTSSDTHPTITISSLLSETNRRTNRNASNVFGAEWRTEEETPVTKEVLSSSIDVSKREAREPPLFGFDQTTETSLKASRPQSSLSGTSGVDTLPPSTMTSVIDAGSVTVRTKPDLPVSLLETASPITDQIGSETMPTRTPAPSAMSSVLSPPPQRPVSAASPAKEAKKAPHVKAAPKPPPKKTKAGAPRGKRTVRAASASAATRTKSAEERAAAAAAAAKERAEREERERARLAEKKAAMEAAARVEKERRLAQAALLQDRIKSAEEQRAEQQKVMERRKRETEQRLKALMAEEDTMRQMEEEARHQIMANRKEMREERERRRQEELEKRKEEIRRRREDDERRQEQATRREREMLARLGDPALQRRMEEDDAARRAERERLMMEHLAEEERFAAERAAAEDARLAEFERLAEEEAVARLREDMDEMDERRRTLLREQEELRREEEELNQEKEPSLERRRSLARDAVVRRARARRELARPAPSSGPVQRAVQLFAHLLQLAHACNRWPPRSYRPKIRRQTPLIRLHRLAVLAEQRKMEEEREREAERQRQREEEERQMQIKLELEEAELQNRIKAEAALREAEEMRRRERNQEVRSHLAGLQLNQHLTRPWVFSYFVHWPRDLFEKPVGGGTSKQKRFRFPPPKSAGQNKGSLPPL